MQLVILTARAGASAALGKRREWLQPADAPLEPEYTAVNRRIDVDGVLVQNFAADARISPNNASVRMFRTREARREHVRTACGTCAEHGCLECSGAKMRGTIAARAAQPARSLPALMEKPSR